MLSIAASASSMPSFPRRRAFDTATAKTDAAVLSWYTLCWSSSMPQRRERGSGGPSPAALSSSALSVRACAPPSSGSSESISLVGAKSSLGGWVFGRIIAGKTGCLAPRPAVVTVGAWALVVPFLADLLACPTAGRAGDPPSSSDPISAVRIHFRSRARAALFCLGVTTTLASPTPASAPTSACNVPCALRVRRFTGPDLLLLTV
jgi:hypothetical protein